MLRIDNITRDFSDGEETVHALRELSYSFPDTGFITIVGPSGSGKSTLINILSGLDKPTSGELTYGETNLLSQTEEWWDDFRNTKIGIVFQDYQLFEEKTVLENTVYPLYIQDIEEETANRYAREMLSYVGLEDAYDKKVVKLSGGQKQRVAIARTVAKNPEIILADEPTGNLDEENSRKVFKLLQDASKHRLVIVVSHDKDLCREYADVILTLRNGRITAEAKMNHDKIGTDEMSIDFLRGSSREPKPLDRKMRYKSVFEAVKRRKARAVIAVIMLTILTTMVSFMSMLAYSDDVRSITSYVNKKEIHMIPLKLMLSEDEQVLAQKEALSQGEKTEKYFSDIVGPERVISFYEAGVDAFRLKPYCIDIPKEEQTEDDFELAYSGYVRSFLMDKEDYSHLSILGRVPENIGELIMSAPLAEKCGISVSDLPCRCKIDGEEACVVGVADKAFGVSLEDRQENNYLERDQALTQMNAVYMYSRKQGYAPPVLQVFGFDMVTARGLRDYVLNDADISSIKDVEYSYIVGRRPEALNEMMIGEDLLRANKLQPEIVLDKEYKLKDLYSDEYGKAFWDRMNLTDMVGKTVKIVGVAQMSGMQGISIDYGVTDELYGEVVKWWISPANTSAASFCSDSISLELVRSLWRKDARFDLETLGGFYKYCRQRDDNRTLIIGITCILMTVLLLMMIYIFSYRISDDKKRIALLRSVGVRKTDITKLYVSEAMITTGIVLTASAILSVIMCKIANLIFIDRFMNGVDIRAISVRPMVLFIVMALLSVAVFISVFIPLRKLQKKKPMEIFKAV